MILLRLSRERDETLGPAPVVPCPKSSLYKALRIIFWAVLDSNSWSKRYNSERYKIFNSDDIISIKLSRMRWARHIVGMSLERTELNNFNATPYNRRPKGKPKRGWKDWVYEDLEKET
ncbi:hypothetical protein TNCV_1629731 [Trichonephila clavipes]|uniref:Uncharacterized protein n=1 Tax=Trichonephila clavipes TaxID=2585209 RepID=A0A8X6WA92_TRICX|nr:hypothetical protein TNCV_1629731 [Trichonephila clavipes]